MCLVNNMFGGDKDSIYNEKKHAFYNIMKTSR